MSGGQRTEHWDQGLRMAQARSAIDANWRCHRREFVCCVALGIYSKLRKAKSSQALVDTGAECATYTVYGISVVK